ncbi:hypothetical protein HUK80_00130 [Flavobacterium sp. MAH-1]|uniref:Transporter n=1 Tax=Flavobacterium agri TaxID=2743471 RepID=A0A7Y8XYX0_9FLAO|nr:hypothetical protein [Flavobacterium agri]NUY79283.1 hypothetical protein [Flavobacterium agri]NYA69307.1 hypothetical protein [Flavobacterium agri]
MKQFYFFLISALMSGSLSAQMSSRSFVPFSPVNAGGGPRFVGATQFDATGLPTFGLYGIGNTNTETFNEINASGKLSGYIRPFKGTIKGIPAFVDINFGFNVNASNTDSLAVSTILFPDVGKNSFSASTTLNFVFGNKPNYYLVGPFYEFANKTIKGRNEDSTRNFYTLNNSFGLNLQYLFVEGNDKVSFAISPYLAFLDVPNPGKEDYKYLLTGDEDSPLATSVNSWGAKVTFQYNYFQIFADFRTVKGSEEELPVSGFKGFHPNIGIVFNAEIFEK